MSLPRAQFRYYEYSTVGNFLGFAKKLNTDSSQTLLIFPSHSSHHVKTSTLYSRKAGIGRVNLTHAKGDLKIPTLGLPIAGIDFVTSKDQIPNLAKNAVADLWKAAGYGINLVLPVRRQMNNTYFPRSLHDFSSHEPEFWGFKNEAPNVLLAEYYLEQLQLLRQYLNADPSQKPALPGPLLAAYQEGERARQAAITPPWFSTNPRLWNLLKKPQPLTLAVEEESLPLEQQKPTSPLSSPSSLASSPSSLHNNSPSSLHNPSPLPSSSPKAAQGSKEQSSASPEKPSYESIYQKQEKARWWKTALAITVGILTLPTLIIPLLSYALWRRAKKNELVQKFEMTPTEYAAIKEARQALTPPKLVNEAKVKPHKQVIQTANQDPAKKAVYYLDNEQAKRLRFFAERMRVGDGRELNKEERELLTQSKNESIKLAPSLGYK